MTLSLFARRALVCGCLTIAPAALFGQTNTYLTNGVEYTIAGLLPGDQVRPSLSVKTTGGYIVWEDNLTQWGTFNPDTESREDGIDEAITKIASDILNKSVSSW